MKRINWILAVVAVVLATGCATVVRPRDISGTWNWTCCDGAYSGRMELTESADGSITGRMFETSGGAGGSLRGIINGNFVQFTREWDVNEQLYNLVIGEDGRSMAGKLEGVRDWRVGTQFQAKRD